MSATRSPFRRILGPHRGEAEEVTLPEGHEEIEQQELGQLFGRVVGARVAVIPLMLMGFGWVTYVHVTLWRRAILGGMGILVPLFFVLEWLRFRRRGFTPLTVPGNLVVAVLAVGLLSFASGGLQSPFIVVYVVFAMTNGLFSPRSWRRVVPFLELAVVWGLFAVGEANLLPPDFYPAAFGSSTSASHHLAVALVLSTILLVVTSITGLTRSALERTIGRSLLAQQESLRAHAERAEELTALSAEIAHELKNPLASVKGLAALLARDAAESFVSPEPGTGPASTSTDKSVERLQVLRREVDRMQSSLEGFLNFSRPLVPLALGECDVSGLCREVAALHEGMARERGVEVTAASGNVRVRCDPRKVKQVLLNLVQNALDASAPGSTVTLESELKAGGGALVRVLDRGRGLAPEIKDSVWQPGVTTKPTGSGLGLTIARALARQHGGDLVLRPREGGGTTAEMWLPGGAAIPPRSFEGHAA